MKKTEIIKCLKANKKISSYEIFFKETNSRELFYVLKHLEINRAVNVEDVLIEVYVDNNDRKGVSSVVVTSADTKETLNKKLNAAVQKASKTTNKYYPLVKKQTNIKEKKPKHINLNDVATKVAKAVYKADIYKDGWINSCEIFVSEIKNEFVNSNGINHVSYSHLCQVEIIPTWKKGDDEYELLKYTESNDFNYAQITKDASEILKLSKYRSEAVNVNSLNIPKGIKVLVQDDMLRDLVSNLKTDSSYQYLYLKQNHYKKNDVISNTKFNLTLNPIIKGCINSSKYDDHGIKLKAKNIIKNGVLIDNWGDIRFGHYLNVKNITGNIPNAVIDAPSYNYKKEKHIIVEHFSAPQLEGFSGYFGGEVRLALYYDGEKYIPITGFAIAGNIYESLKNVKFSKEKTSNINYSGPRYFIFDDVSIN